jgi:iron-sulfur cluster insertion protein
MTTVTLSENAARRVAALKLRTNRPDSHLRVSVEGGGCSGFQYKFGFDDQVGADDMIIERDGVTLLVDATSLPFMEDAVVDYVETLGAAAFEIRNPNAASSCGCGNSFAV